MTRKVIGYDQGKTIWSKDEGPGSPPISGRIRGELVVGGPATPSLYIPTEFEAKKKRAAR